MATAGTNAGVGSLLREWRERRRLTQLAVALEAGVSARHLSFVETGRSKPGRANVLRIGFHPRGLAPLIVNLANWRAHFLERLARQIAITGDDALRSLMGEVAAYPVPEGESGAAAEPEGSDILGPVRLRAHRGGEWSFFGMFASFDTPFEVTTSELAIELLFPADHATTEAFRNGAP